MKKSEKKLSGEKSMTQARAAEIRQKVVAALKKRQDAARDAALAAFQESGVPDLFSDADLVINDLKEISEYTLDGCQKGAPRLLPFTMSLIKRMVTTAAYFEYEPWMLKELSDADVLEYGAFRDDDAYLANFCLESGCFMRVECREEYAAQRKVLSALSNYVRVSAAFAKEIGSRKSAEIWLRALCAIRGYDHAMRSIPLNAEQTDRIFAYIDEAATEMDIDWLYPQIPPLAEMRKKAED